MDSQLSEIWGGVFFSPDFVESGRTCLGLEGGTAVIEYNGAPIGVSNILFRKKLGIVAATLPLMFQYYGVLLFDRAFERVLNDEIERFLGRICDYAYICFTPDFQPNEGLSKKWNLIRQTTLALTSGDLENWGTSFRADVKNKINKAKREKVAVEKSDEFPSALWETTYHRRKMKPPVSARAFSEWCRKMIADSILSIYTASVEGRPVAFRGELVYGGFAYDWIAGSDPDFHRSGCNQLLMAEIGNDLRNRNIGIWDLVDARIGSIAEFKRSFGAKDYYHWQANRGFNLKGKLFGVLRNIKNARR